MTLENLKELGLNDDQVKAVMEQYGKDVTKLQNENKKLTADRDNWKQKAETAEDTLKKFDGIDPEQMKKEVEDWKQKAQDAEKDYQQKIYDRDFNDALTAAFGEIKFTSESAKKAVMAEVKEAGLKLNEGKILGLSDLIGQIRERDASAFVDEKQQQAQQQRARFTTTFAGTGTGGTYTKADFKKMSLDERIRLKESDPELYKQLTQ